MPELPEDYDEQPGMSTARAGLIVAAYLAVSAVLALLAVHWYA